MLEQALQGNTLTTEQFSDYYGMGAVARYLLDRDPKQDAHWTNDSPGLQAAARRFHELLTPHFSDEQLEQVMEGLRTAL